MLDKIPVHYSIGHLVVAGSDTTHPYGKWLVAMNKLSKGRHLSVGPSQPEVSQLIDITGAKMKMVYEAFTEPEPHFAQILKADKIKPIEVYPKDENKDPNAIWDAARGRADAQRQRSRRQSHRHPQPLRPRPDRRTGRRHADRPRDQHRAVARHDSRPRPGREQHERHDRPGRDPTFQLKLTKPGVFPFYCTNFCSALHQEMQGYLVVQNEGAAAGARVVQPAAPPAPADARGEPTSRGTGRADPRRRMQLRQR